MSKGSGNTRKAYPQAKEPTIEDYPIAEWDHTHSSDSGGFVVTERGRLIAARASKNEKGKYEKEKRMCIKYADFGFKIEHLAEKPSISSSDVNVRGYGQYGSLVKANGELADLKSTSSANNISKYARYAIKEQHAKKVLFEFTSRKNEDKIHEEINKISKRGMHGYYYFTGDDKPTKF